MQLISIKPKLLQRRWWLGKYEVLKGEVYLGLSNRWLDVIGGCKIHWRVNEKIIRILILSFPHSLSLDLSHIPLSSLSLFLSFLTAVARSGRKPALASGGRVQAHKAGARCGHVQARPRACPRARRQARGPGAGRSGPT